MIILTQAQADAVRGVTTPGHELEPARLINGTDWVLPEEVLTDPAHAIRHDYLAALPTRIVDLSEYPKG